MFIDSEHLKIPEEEQDLYSAHEVLQMMPLVQKDDIYEHFLEENSWVKQYLYNAWNEKRKQKIETRKQESFLISVSCILFSLLEKPSRLFQLWYMRKHRTTEKISDTVVRFHPRDTRVFIRQNYLKLLRKYKIPLDSRFLDSLQ
jgi:hypothetical protein